MWKKANKMNGQSIKGHQEREKGVDGKIRQMLQHSPFPKRSDPNLCLGTFSRSDRAFLTRNAHHWNDAEIMVPFFRANSPEVKDPVVISGTRGYFKEYFLGLIHATKLRRSSMLMPPRILKVWSDCFSSVYQKKGIL